MGLEKTISVPVFKHQYLIRIIYQILIKIIRKVSPLYADVIFIDMTLKIAEI